MNRTCDCRIGKLEAEVRELEAKIAGPTKPEQKPVWPKEGWVNFYDNGFAPMYMTRDSAESFRGIGCIGTVRYVRAED
ncbi:MAG: hypothetical protein WC485_00275 [Opitutaceae bacterium]